jgi:hypothetical protein
VEEVRGHTLGRRAGLREELGRALVAELSLGATQVGVHGGAQHRVHERQWPARAKDLGPDEPGCRAPGFLELQLGERGGRRQLGLAEDRDSPGKRLRRRAEPAKPLQDEAGERLRAQLADACRGIRTRPDPLGE